MNKRTRKGASLIEVLVVMVVFLVGILGIIQIFPTGLGILRTTRNNTMAAAMARAEVQRIQGNREQVADYIAPVIYSGGTSVIVINPRQRWDQLMPAGDTGTGVGHIGGNGAVTRDAAVIGNWDKVSGANMFTRVIGEGRRIPAPRVINAVFASVMQLQFAPIYYFTDPGTGVADERILTVYGNDFRQRWGNADRNNPNIYQNSRDYEFYFVDADDAQVDSPFVGRDQVWLGRAKVGGAPIPAKYRFAFSFLYDNGGSVDNYDVIVRIDIDPAAPPTGVAVVGDYYVIDMAELVGYTSVYGGSSVFAPGSVLSIDGGSVRVQRVFNEVSSFSGDPYEYAVANGQLGTLYINPNGFNTKVYNTGGDPEALVARADYTVYDWRILRDEVTLSSTGAGNVKLTLNSIRVASRPGPDGVTLGGLGMSMPDVSAANGNRDFVVQDVDTGGVILGGPDAANSSYIVDYSNGSVTFKDTEGAPGVQGQISFLDIAGNWTAPVPIDMANRRVRILYMGNGEWAMQAHKAASSYRQSFGIGAGLSVAEYYVGGSVTGVGSTNRLYFPICDLGHRVVIREIWYQQAGNRRSLNDQEFYINGVENIGGVDHAYADLTTKTGLGASFDLSGGRYPVRGVRGASMRVRVLWNPESFRLTGTDTENYENLERWMQSTRRIQTESFLTKGARN